MDNGRKASETISGTVENIVYKNDLNGYTVCDIDCDGNPVTVVGVMPFLNEGESITVTGEWTHHSSFGRQFKAEHYEKHLPTSKESILTYLSSGAVKGMGPVTASRIIDKYGEDSLEVLENHPEWLAEIKGITLKKAREMSESYRAQFGVRNIMMFYNGLFGPALSMKIYKRWGAASVDVIKNNPFILCDEILGIGFERADRVAETLGIDKNSPFRLEAGIKYVLSGSMSKNGNCYLPMEQLCEYSAKLLEADGKAIDDVLIRLVSRGELIAVKYGEQTAIYLERAYKAERYCAEKLLTLSRAAINIPTKKTEQYISETEEEIGMAFAALQKKAVEMAVNRGFVIVTGGPGTGKTTVIRAILKIFDVLDIKTLLAAPTGRAAKRMSVATMREAKTIHRLLEVDFASDDRLHFMRNEDNPLDAGAIIIDEASMVDIFLLHALLKAIKPGTKLILIGDADQLPPVGAGDALRDILNSGVFDYIKLKDIFRQAQDSHIILNAHKINSGEMPDLKQKSSDFFFMQRQLGRDAVALVAELCEKRLPNAYGFDPLSDIQVITPTKKGETGTVHLNRRLQEVLNPMSPSKTEKVVRDITFREGDKVMQTKNDYSLDWEDFQGNEGSGVFNGDIGIINRINTAEESFTIQFDDKTVKYDFSQFDEIEHAFAITVHKSQGSEYKAVIIPAFDSAPGLLTRNMLYTAVTRAQNIVIIIGKESIVGKMVENDRQITRFTGLSKMLKSDIKK